MERHLQKRYDMEKDGRIGKDHLGHNFLRNGLLGVGGMESYHSVAVRNAKERATRGRRPTHAGLQAHSSSCQYQRMWCGGGTA